MEKPYLQYQMIEPFVFGRLIEMTSMKQHIYFFKRVKRFFESTMLLNSFYFCRSNPLVLYGHMARVWDCYILDDYFISISEVRIFIIHQNLLLSL